MYGQCQNKLLSSIDCKLWRSLEYHFGYEIYAVNPLAQYRGVGKLAICIRRNVVSVMFSSNVYDDIDTSTIVHSIGEYCAQERFL